VKQTAQLRRNWLAFAIVGLLLSGLGISLVGEAIILKASKQAYFLMGTAGLVAFNAGLSIFGQSVIFRYRYLKAKGREAADRRSGNNRNRGRGRGPKRSGNRPSGGEGSGEGNARRNSGFKSRFEE
jgi:hypothetical protein